MEGDLETAGGDEPAGGLQQPRDERSRPPPAVTLCPAGERLPAAAGAADAARTRVLAPHRAGDEDAPVRPWRALLPRGPRRRWAGAAGASLGGTRLVATMAAI